LLVFSEPHQLTDILLGVKKHHAGAGIAPSPRRSSRRERTDNSTLITTEFIRIVENFRHTLGTDIGKYSSKAERLSAKEHVGCGERP